MEIRDGNGTRGDRGDTGTRGTLIDGESGRTMMTWKAFRQERQRTTPSYTKAEQRLVAALGIAGEAGEIVDAIKKEAFHSHPEDRAEALKEAGDLLWYVDLFLASHGATFEDALAAVVAKLRLRYPDGFDAQRSIHRTE